ncbi:hypothetical protein EQ827_06605 [Lactobacillus bombi]|nr:hypothetical protein [Bombilactobacillus bombi]
MTININNAANPENIVTSNGYGDQKFLNYLGLSAQKLASNNDLYASVMIAQALLESGWGTSGLAQAPNYNLFGVKGTYEGQSVNFSTQEDDGAGNLFSINSGFRRYPSYKESLEDYVRVLRSNEQLYGPVWRSNAPTYQDATKALTGHYATDTTYDQKLNGLIEKYNLTRFDQSPTPGEQLSVNDIVVNKVNWVVNQTQPHLSASAYQKQQAPVIILNHYNHSFASASKQPNVKMPVAINDEISEAINLNKEITQIPPVKALPLINQTLPKKHDAITVKKQVSKTDQSNGDVSVNKEEIPANEKNTEKSSPAQLQ